MSNTLNILSNSQGTLQFSGGVLGQDWKKVAEQTLAREQKKIDTLKKNIDRRDIQAHATSDLQNKVADLQKAVQNLKGITSSQTQTVFDTKVATIKPQQSFGAHVTPDALVGSYTIGVQQTASAHKFRSDSQISGNTPLNLDGSLIIATSADGTQNPVIFDIKPSDTLETIAKMMNQGSSMISASILHVDDNNCYLNVTHQQTGQTLHIAPNSTSSVVTGLGLGVVANGGGYTVKNTVQQARPALFTIDGQSLTRSTNMVHDALPGVILDLYAASNEPSVMVIENDLAHVKSCIQAFIEAYNGLRDAVNTQMKKNPDGTPASDAPLYRSELIQTLDLSLERLAYGHGSTQGPIQSLLDLGISIAARTSAQDTNAGKFSLNENTLDTHLLTHFDQIKTLFQNTWNSADHHLSVKTWPASLKDFPAGFSLDVIMTDGILTQTQNNQGWSTQIQGSAITFTSGPAQGLTLEYTGQNTHNGIACTYQVGLSQKMNQTLEMLIGSEHSLFATSHAQSTREQEISKKELSKIEASYQEKMDKEIKKYTKMEVEYARIQEILKSVQDMKNSWFNSK